jgi:hypothetical protein
MKPELEVARLAGQLGWYVLLGGLLDCDIPESKNIGWAIRRAKKAYPRRKITVCK